MVKVCCCDGVSGIGGVGGGQPSSHHKEILPDRAENANQMAAGLGLGSGSGRGMSPVSPLPPLGGTTGDGVVIVSAVSVQAVSAGWYWWWWLSGHDGIGGGGSVGGFHCALELRGAFLAILWITWSRGWHLAVGI